MANHPHQIDERTPVRTTAGLLAQTGRVIIVVAVGSAFWAALQVGRIQALELSRDQNAVEIAKLRQEVGVLAQHIADLNGYLRGKLGSDVAQTGAGKPFRPITEDSPVRN